MKPATLPAACGVALAMMSAAGASHWWSVRELVTAVQHGVELPSAPLNAAPALPPPAAPKPTPSEELRAPVLAARTKANPVASAPATPDAGQQKFYETLVARMENLQNQNRDLLNQVAETNRDMMNLNFRVDTFSESFRPMPVSDERADTSYQDGPGVLPPRAEPVRMPFDE